MNRIKIKDKYIALDLLNAQRGSEGRDFRLSAIQRGKQKKWVKNSEESDFYFIFKYLDDNTFFSMHVSAEEHFLSKLNHKQTLKLMRP